MSIYPHSANAGEGAKAKDFLTYSAEQQKWWIGGAVEMAGHIAYLENPDKGGCVWRWYFEDAAAKETLVLKSMAKYPDATPTAIVIALAERACGKFPRGADATSSR
ncbi:hypothetical protein MJD09_03310 [bacterium]|nr:hypothetical protein [bacterium]